MADNLNESELRGLEESSQREPIEGRDRVDESAALAARIYELEAKFNAAHGQNGINVNWPVISFDGETGSKKNTEQSEPVTFYRNGILVTRRMVVAGTASTSL